MADDVYDVRVTKGGTSAVLPDAFTVYGDGEAKLEARLIAPGAVSPGFPVRQTFWIEYANTGTRAMPPASGGSGQRQRPPPGRWGQA